MASSSTTWPSSNQVRTPDRGSWNYILVASDGSLDDLAVDEADGLVMRGDELAALVGDALVLDDDFAPVDQLRQGR